MDIKGFPEDIYVPDGRNAGHVEYIHGGVSRNVVEDIANLELRPTFLGIADNTALGEDVVRKLQRHKVNTEYMKESPNGMGTWLAVFDHNGDLAGTISQRPNLMPILDILEENGDEYQDLVRFEKDQFGQILAVQTDVVKVNTMKSRMIARVSQKLNDASAATIRIPLGNATGMDLLYGRGPKIPLRMIPLGSANADFVSVFTNAGINQTRHQVVIEAEVELNVLAPGSETTLTVSSQISVAETVLIGNVPDSYTYLDTQGENLLQDYYLLKNKGDQVP